MNFPLITTDEDMLIRVKEWEIAGLPVIMRKRGTFSFVELRNPETFHSMDRIEVGKYPPKARYERSGEHWMLTWRG